MGYKEEQESLCKHLMLYILIGLGLLFIAVVLHELGYIEIQLLDWSF